MNEERQYYFIHTKNYRLQIDLKPDLKCIIFYFKSKSNNLVQTQYIAKYTSEDDLNKLFWKLRSYRRLYLNPEIPSIRQISEQSSFQLTFSNIVSDLNDEERQNNDQVDQSMNYAVKYLRKREKNIYLEGIYDSRLKQAQLYIIQKRKFQNIFTTLTIERKNLSSKLNQSQILLQIQKSVQMRNDWLYLKAPSLNFLSVSHYEEEKNIFKEKLGIFRHIFLTQIITHCIINHFGKVKYKQKMIKWDRSQTFEYFKYWDEQLEELRGQGKRFSQFKDPIKLEKKKLSKLQKGEKAEVQKLVPKWEKFDGICNFTLISDAQKSKINKVRYLLHQMTRQFDRNQAYVDFVSLLFELVPKEELYPLQPDECWSFKEFKTNIKTKLDSKACIREYTKDSFFHQVLNKGLRNFTNTRELSFLRLPFSHIFWSVKKIYHRHLRSIFKRRKQSNKNTILQLYRGCYFNQKQLKTIEKSIGNFLELEGFISTSKKHFVGERFMINTLLKIIIPFDNLGGVFDYGFANLIKYSCHPNEAEILINTFNLFKVLSFKIKRDSQNQDQCFQICLEYGGLHSIQTKISKSLRLLNFQEKIEKKQKQNSEIIKKIQELKRKEKLKPQQFERYLDLILKDKEKIKNKKKQLQQVGKVELERKIKSLSSWEQQLVINSRYQLRQLNQIENYGQLLFKLEQYEECYKYCKQKVKQAEWGKIIQGHNWRKSIFLVQKEQMNRWYLSHSCRLLGRFQESLQSMKKHLQLIHSLTVKKYSNREQVSLLFWMYVICRWMVGKEKQKQTYRKQLVSIFTNNEAKQLEFYKLFMSLNNGKPIIKSEDFLKMREKINLDLEILQLKTSGKNNINYKNKLWTLVYLSFEEKDWKSTLKIGKKYLQLRQETPGRENRTVTCAVFLYLLYLCDYLKLKQKLRFLCEQILDFMNQSIFNSWEFEVFLRVIEKCLKLKEFRAGKKIILKLAKTRLQFTLEEQHINHISLYGYVLLLFGGEQTEVLEFLNWFSRLYEEQKLSKAKFFQKMLKQITQYNQKVNYLVRSRHKDEQDNIVRRFAYQHIKEGAGQWKTFTWTNRMGDLIPFQNPFYPLILNITYIVTGLDKVFLVRCDPLFYLQYLRKFIESQKNILKNKADKRYYIKRLQVISKLHLCRELLPKINLLHRRQLMRRKKKNEKHV